jgi:hypothetical protein
MTTAKIKENIKNTLKFSIRGAVAFLLGLLISYAVRNDRSEDSPTATTSNWIRSASVASSQGP